MTKRVKETVQEERTQYPNFNWDLYLKGNMHKLLFSEVISGKTVVSDFYGLLHKEPGELKIETPSQLDDLWRLWQRNVADVGKSKYFNEIPSSVMDYFQATKQYNKAPQEFRDLLFPKKETDMHPIDPPSSEQLLTNIPAAKPVPKFAWSFTGLDAFFNGCPRKFAARWFYKTEKFEETEASRWGNRKHKANEQYLKGGAAATDTPELIDRKYCDAFLQAKQAGATLLVEHEIAFNRLWKQVEWFAQDAWGRAKIDVALIVGDTIKLYDWKTGKEKFEEYQLRIFCLFAALAFPQLQKFEARYIWLKEDKISEAVTLTRAEIMPILKETIDRVAMIEEAWNAERFQCRPNGLCKRYCGVEDCPHHGGRK